jgi:hypothetical protein
VLYVEAAGALAQAQRVSRLTTGAHVRSLKRLHDLWEQIDVIEVDDQLIRRIAALAGRLALHG